MPSHIKKRIKKPKPKPKRAATLTDDEMVEIVRQALPCEVMKVTVGDEPPEGSLHVYVDELIEAVRPKGLRSMFGSMK